jgi:hypothetical protein
MSKIKVVNTYSVDANSKQSDINYLTPRKINLQF